MTYILTFLIVSCVIFAAFIAFLIVGSNDQ